MEYIRLERKKQHLQKLKQVSVSFSVSRTCIQPGVTGLGATEPHGWDIKFPSASKKKQILDKYRDKRKILLLYG